MKHKEDVEMGCIAIPILLLLVLGVNILLAHAIIWAHNILVETPWPHDWPHVFAIIVVLFVLQLLFKPRGRKS